MIAMGSFVFVSGQIPTRDGQLVSGGMLEQATAVLDNLTEVLRAAGVGLSDVVRCGVHVADLEALPAFNSVYSRVFAEHLPARTTVGVQLPGYLVEVDCIAVTDAATKRT